MALNKEEASRVGYKAKINWYKERATAISEGKVTLEQYLAEKNTDFEAVPHTPEEIISILNDLQKKALKLEDKIAYLSANLKIPVDAAKQPELAKAVKDQDPSSSGEYISYTLYDKLLLEKEFANSKITADYLIKNTTGDSSTDSVIVHDAILSGYADYNGQNSSLDNWQQRYLNRWLNNAVSWNEHEYQIQQILNFSDNYLDMFPDPAFIPWSARREVAQGRVDAKSLADLWKYFSADYAGKIDNMTTGIGDLLALRPDKNITDLTTRFIVYGNQFLNKLNEVFDFQWAPHLICCFMQWGVRLDTKTLKGLRALLQLFQTGLSFDARDILNGIKDIINNIMRGLLTNQLVALVNLIIQKICDPIKEWIQNPDDTWRKIFACTPIAELIQTFITQAIDYLQVLFVNLIQNWYKQLELENIHKDMKIEIFKQQKIAGDLAKLLDGVIAATELAAQCGIPASPNSEVVQQVISSYSIGNQDKYEFPAEENPTIYNSFIVSATETPVNSAAPAETVGMNQGAFGAQAGTVTSGTQLDECLKKIPADQVSGVKQWIDLINSKSQGSA